MRNTLALGLLASATMLAFAAEEKTPAAAPKQSEPVEAKPKVEIKDLLQQPSFTNHTGMLLVKISPALWAGKYEVTQEEYKKVAGSNPSQFAGDRNPVDSVSWSDAKGFCAKLDEAERKEEMLPEGFSYTLPTLEQWESLMADAKLSDAVTSEGKSRSGTAPVGSLSANSLGLCDTRGNVWEWCLDPEDKPYRVLRGAGWSSWIEVNLRPEFCWYSDGPDQKKNTFGFRCVLLNAGGK